MTDLLVRLYDLPSPEPLRTRLAVAGVTIRRPNAWEKSLVVDWVRAGFGAGWADECDVAFAARPASCFVALERDALVGFACHDGTRRNFFGPLGVAAAARGRGIGSALVVACLAAMRDAGYAYAIVGGADADAEAFYARAVGATPIAGSAPGIYDLAFARAARRGGPADPA